MECGQAWTDALDAEGGRAEALPRAVGGGRWEVSTAWLGLELWGFRR